MNDAFETGKVIGDDLQSGNHLPSEAPAGREMILDKLKQKGVVLKAISSYLSYRYLFMAVVVCDCCS